MYTNVGIIRDEVQKTVTDVSAGFYGYTGQHKKQSSPHKGIFCFAFFFLTFLLSFFLSFSPVALRAHSESTAIPVSEQAQTGWVKIESILRHTHLTL